MEAMVWRQLNHRNILPLVGVALGVPYKTSIALVAPWMANGSLDAYLKGHDDADRVEIVSSRERYCR